MPNNGRPFALRRFKPSDVDAVIALDEQVTGIAKRDYWRELFERYQTRRPHERFFFVAQSEDGRLLGFITGEVRAWEFGSEPCGWIIAVSVTPQAREHGVGEALMEHLCGAFRDAGVTTLRTMISRSNHLLLSFFRSEGMRAGTYLQLEKRLE
jgi:GNAT superfamily N-acetyltransferase